jgi:hypothetical protein
MSAIGDGTNISILQQPITGSGLSVFVSFDYDCIQLLVIKKKKLNRKLGL